MIIIIIIEGIRIKNFNMRSSHGHQSEVDGIEAETGSFVGDAVFDREPVELLENGSDVSMFCLVQDKLTNLSVFW